MIALYIGREKFPDAIFYASNNSHYSIFKIAKMLKLNLCVVNCQGNGEMDYADFEQKLLLNIAYPALILATIGTTMKGATDNTMEIHRILKRHGKDHDYYLHLVDCLFKW